MPGKLLSNDNSDRVIHGKRSIIQPVYADENLPVHVYAGKNHVYAGASQILAGSPISLAKAACLLLLMSSRL